MKPNLLLAFCIVMIVLIVYYNTLGNTIQVVANDRKWNVSPGYDNANSAANLLSKTHRTMIEFMRTLKKKYHIDEPTDSYLGTITDHSMGSHNAVINNPNDTYNIINHLLDNYNPDVFYENDPRFSTDTSYTQDKGASMHICLRRKDDSNQLVDPGILLFVMLHEMSHIANYNGWGHERDFWIVFKFILHEAKLAGIYEPVDYSKYPIDYCGLYVNYSPYFNDDLPSLWR